MKFFANGKRLTFFISVNFIVMRRTGENFKFSRKWARPAIPWHVSIIREYYGCWCRLVRQAEKIDYLRNRGWRKPWGHCATNQCHTELLNLISCFSILNRVDSTRLSFVSVALFFSVLARELPFLGIWIFPVLKYMTYELICIIRHKKEKRKIIIIFIYTGYNLFIQIIIYPFIQIKNLVHHWCHDAILSSWV